MPRIFISAAHKSSGKTTVTLGLCAALRVRGLAVQPFKKGPDYIDPMWLGRAAGRACHNLDFYTMGRDEIRDTVAHHEAGTDISVIEGNKGLYDGLDLDGSNSNAALAKLLHTPVVLVLDARGMTRGIAPLILGYQAFDPDIRIAGVILNQLGGHRHEAKLRAVIEHYTDVPVIGAVSRDSGMEIPERHLGLIPSNEEEDAEHHIQRIGKAIGEQVDLDRLLQVAAAAPVIESQAPESMPPATAGRSMRIGIAHDDAFGFYYPGDLQAFERQGATLVPLDMIRDTALPELDGLFIGGGFPESRMDELAANTAMRTALRQAVETGLPVYAECGGLMYLARSLRWQGRSADMVGAIPADVVMCERPQGRGYVRLRETVHSPWPQGDGNGSEIAAHEFHYSRLENLDPGLDYAFEVTRGTGIDGRHDGLIYRNLLACYSHRRDTRRDPWVRRFLDFVSTCRLDDGTTRPR